MDICKFIAGLILSAAGVKLGELNASGLIILKGPFRCLAQLAFNEAGEAFEQFQCSSTRVYLVVRICKVNHPQGNVAPEIGK